MKFIKKESKKRLWDRSQQANPKCEYLTFDLRQFQDTLSINISFGFIFVSYKISNLRNLEFWLKNWVRILKMNHLKKFRCVHCKVNTITDIDSFRMCYKQSCVVIVYLMSNAWTSEFFFSSKYLLINFLLIIVQHVTV